MDYNYTIMNLRGIYDKSCIVRPGWHFTANGPGCVYKDFFRLTDEKNGKAERI